MTLLQHSSSGSGALVAPQPTGQARLRLLDGFELRYGDTPVQVPLSIQRLLAFLALHDRPVLRSHAAGVLWLDSTEEHSTACLRTALWRLRRSDHQLVQATSTHLRLLEGVSVDYWEVTAHAQALLDDASDGEILLRRDTDLLRELLSEWYDDWVLVERERFRQLRLHALEERCRRLAAVGRFAEAVQAGLAAATCEPLRESAHRLLIVVHLAEGNRFEAVRQFHAYRRVMSDELGLPPSPQIAELVRGLDGRPVDGLPPGPGDDQVTPG
jgi:DNA-binding SARP family transcriptional activator